MTWILNAVIYIKNKKVIKELSISFYDVTFTGKVLEIGFFFLRHHPRSFETILPSSGHFT